METVKSLCRSEGELQEYLDGEAPDREAIRRHLLVCAECRAGLEEIGAADSFARERLSALPRLDQLPVAPPVPELHLLPPHQPWFAAFPRNLRDAVNPPKLPPLHVTSKPVEVKSLAGLYGGNEKRSGVLSLAIHGAAVVLAFALGANENVRALVEERVMLTAVELAPYIAKPARQPGGGGGGGGDRSPLAASKGKLPKLSTKQFTPPRAVIHNPDPKLPMEPTIVAPPDVPNINAANIGDPLSKFGVPSNGTGFGNGMGSGSYGGVGSGSGPGFGLGRGPGFGGGVYRVGGGVSAPQVLLKVEPEYSEEARKARWQGVVVLSVVVDEKGQPRDLRVVRSLGLGLDQKAIEAAEKWKFKPGLKDGRPVPVAATIEVNFRLL
ncbi:MAG: TonB family protein [Bryobacteraceae bacterium]|nr:TonB family protein [Bryobacteraceae bacterium]